MIPLPNTFMTLPGISIKSFRLIWPLSVHPRIGQEEKWEPQPGVKKNGGAYLPKASPLKVTSNDYFYSNPPLEVKKNKHLGLWEVNLPTSFRYLPRSFLQKLDFFLLLCCPNS
jgi:hypothetical protein